MSIHNLKARDLLRLPDGLHNDGGGLHLRVQSNGASRSWLFRFVQQGSRKTIAIGPLKKISLDEARQIAKDIQQGLRNGKSPKGVLQEIKRLPAKQEETTFASLLDSAIAAIAGVRRWRGSRTESEWRQTLTDYALPKLGGMSVDLIQTSDVVAVLLPIWEKKNPTAIKVLSHLTAIFDWCIAKGYREKRNPALWRELQFSLAPSSRVHRVEHLKAAPMDEAPVIAAKLWAQDRKMGSAALFGMLTATRVNEFLGARWSEVDFEAKVWCVPPERRKDGVPYPHRVPLSKQALALLNRQERKTELVFPGRFGSSLCIDSPRQALKRLGYEVTMHGMRSVFRDWCAKTRQDWVASEKALSHSVGNKVTQAYLRTDLLEERRELMQQWADFLLPSLG